MPWPSHPADGGAGRRAGASTQMWGLNYPGVPLGPWAPVLPCSPCSPFSPWGPAGPAGPAGPVAPAGPAAPAAPVSPFSPWAPVSPWGPGGPWQALTVRAAAEIRAIVQCVVIAGLLQSTVYSRRAGVFISRHRFLQFDCLGWHAQVNGEKRIEADCWAVHAPVWPKCQRIRRLT